LPRPLAFLPGPGVLVTERLAGRPLLEMGPAGSTGIDVAIRLLADLHACDAVPARRRTAAKIVRSVRRKAAEASTQAPALAGLFADVAGRMERARPADGEIVPTHGDFSPRNVLVGPSHAVLIDFDRFQLADPARDVAYFGTWCWAWEVRRGGAGDWTALDET